MLYAFNYDLIGGEYRRADYTILKERILLLEDVVHDEYSTWYISTNTWVTVLQAYLAATLRPEDRYTLEPVPKTIGAGGLSPTVMAWLTAHGVRVLPVLAPAAAHAAKFEHELLRKKQLREMAKEAAERYLRRPIPTRPPLAPLPVPNLVRTPTQAPSLGSLAALLAGNGKSLSGL